MLQQLGEAFLIIIRKRSAKPVNTSISRTLPACFLIGEKVRKRIRPSCSWSSMSACSVDSNRRARVRRSCTSSGEGSFGTFFSDLRSCENFPPVVLIKKGMRFWMAVMGSLVIKGNCPGVVSHRHLIKVKSQRLARSGRISPTPLSFSPQMHAARLRPTGNVGPKCISRDRRKGQLQRKPVLILDATLSRIIRQGARPIAQGSPPTLHLIVLVLGAADESFKIIFA